MALVLSRNVGEKIMIGDDIVVHITAIQGQQVQIAIEAPREIAVDRAEIREAKINNPHRSGNR